MSGHGEEKSLQPKTETELSPTILLITHRVLIMTGKIPAKWMKEFEFQLHWTSPVDAVI
jgi:hypothetical protein